MIEIEGKEMNFAQALQYLEDLNVFGSQLGLTRIQQLMRYNN